MLAGLLYRVSRVLIGTYASLMFNMHLYWQSALQKGPVPFSANHPCTTDPVLIHLISPRLMSVRMHQASVFPGRADPVLDQANQTFEKGQSVAIFPEGLLSLVDGFHSLRSGVAILALKRGVLVIPLGIFLSKKGCRRISTILEGEPNINNWYLDGSDAVAIGKALYFTGNAIDTSQVKNICRKDQEKYPFPGLRKPEPCPGPGLR